MLTDVPNLYVDFGTPAQRAVRSAHPDALDSLEFAKGSMGPKVEAACAFARATGKRAAIGQLSDLDAILLGDAGTLISPDTGGIDYLP
jgi:carbamate kinase